MLGEFLQEQAALYASGVMTSRQREQFELVMEFHDELRDFVIGLLEIGAAVSLAARDRSGVGPSPTARTRIVAAIAEISQESQPEAIVMSGTDGLAQWINPTFSAMCGYTLEELRGKKLGPILQGEKTDRETAARIRNAVHACRACHETILNYHKRGLPYWAEISITPICEESGEPLWLVAREREVSGLRSP